MQVFSSVVLVDRRGRLLLQERDEHPVIEPEKWGPPGGHLEPGEDPLAGAVRELEEETGVRLDPGELRLWREIPVWHAAYGTDDRIFLYAAACDLTDADIECHEGRQIVFVEPSEALGLDLTTAAAAYVPDFLDSELYASLTA